MSSYRTTEEVQTVRKERDPIKLAEEYAIEGNLLTKEELKVHIGYPCARTYIHCVYTHTHTHPLYNQAQTKEVKGHIREAVEYALKGPELPPNELYTDVYNEPEGFVRGCDPFTNNQVTSAV